MKRCTANVSHPAAQIARSNTLAMRECATKLKTPERVWGQYPLFVFSCRRPGLVWSAAAERP